jgi:hypothetical protein
VEILLPWLGNENNEMTKDQIIRLAKEAGIRDCTCDGDFGCIERFASLVAEREWVGLTDEEIDQGQKESWVTKQAWESAVWWAEAKLKEKNT